MTNRNQTQYNQPQTGQMNDMTNLSSRPSQKEVAVVRAFKKWNDAQLAIDALHGLGFTEAQVGIVRMNKDTDQMDHHAGTSAGIDDSKDQSKNVAGGVAAGAAVGGIAAALASLLIPGVGPIVAGGVLATTFGTAVAGAGVAAGVGAGIGAAAGAMVGAFQGLGLSKEESDAYEGELQTGSTIVTVFADARKDEAVRVLEQYGGHTGGH